MSKSNIPVAFILVLAGVALGMVSFAVEYYTCGEKDCLVEYVAPKVK
jgi:hypothetical protein